MSHDVETTIDQTVELEALMMTPAEYAAYQAEVAKVQSQFIGRAFLVPVVFALLILAVWVVLAQLITPGAAGEGMYARSQLILRVVLIAFGLILDAGGAVAVMQRLSHWGKE